MANDLDTLLPAATVVLVRQSNSGLQTLLLRRNSALRFAGGNWVFPGGRIDAGDYPDITVTSDFEISSQRPEGEFAAAKAAAVRETYEETGLTIDADQLVYLAHWVAPPLMKKRFSTWFFIVKVSEAVADQVEIDGGEIHESQWLSPTEALASVEDKSMALLPPTIVTVTELVRFDDVDSVIRYYHDRPPVVFYPRVHVAEADSPSAGQFTFLYQGDAGYQDTNPEVQGPRHRLNSKEGLWRYENTVYE
jgi:8-oxo-dGTP pyrophosphatase MutT (NUDIX family)